MTTQEGERQPSVTENLGRYPHKLLTVKALVTSVIVMRLWWLTIPGIPVSMFIAHREK
jgi:hypothetical protein